MRRVQPSFPRVFDWLTLLFSYYHVLSCSANPNLLSEHYQAPHAKSYLERGMSAPKQLLDLLKIMAFLLNATHHAQFGLARRPQLPAKRNSPPASTAAL